MFDLNFLEIQHEERMKQLAYDYQQGQREQKAVVAFVNRNWQRFVQVLNQWRDGFGSGPRTPELHY